MPIFTRCWLAAPLTLVLVAAAHAASPTTLPSTRPASDTAPAEFAPPGDVTKATDVHPATADELNQVAARVERAAAEMDDRRYALHVRYFTRPRDGTAEQRERNGVAERRAGSRRYELWLVRNVRRAALPGEPQAELEQ